jgi:branched-chain amino acid transport system permease protein
VIGFLETVVIGLTTGAVYALIAMGYNVVFASTGVMNFAHGEFYMGGMMIGAFLAVSAGVPMLLALVITVALGALLGVVLERVAVRGLTDKDAGLGASGWVLSTLGFGIVIQAGITLWMGPELRPFPPLAPFDSFTLAGVPITYQRVVVIVAALLVGLLLHLYLERTKVGRALSAVEQDPDAALLRGIPVLRLGVLAFAIGGGLGALSGFLAAPLSAAVSSAGLAFGLKGFIAAAAGGIPSIKGAVIAGFLLGLLEVFGVALLGAGYRQAIVFAALLVVLMVKPAGLFGTGKLRPV